MSFASDLKDFNEEAEKAIFKVRNLALLGLFSAIINDTPVKFGDLRNNWRMGVDEMQDEPVPKGKLLDAAESPPANQIIGLRKGLTETGADKTIFFYNSLPYAFRVEYEGWSDRAKEGMVRINVDRFRKFVLAALKDLS